LDAWLDFAWGPLLRLSLVILVFGLLRLVVMAVWGIAEGVSRARDKSIAYRQVAAQTLSWMLPVHRLHRQRAANSFASFALHLSLLFGALLFVGHVELVNASLGLSLPTLTRGISDPFTMIGLVAITVLLALRLYTGMTRAMSGPMDYIVLILLFVPFLTGYIASRPWNPMSYDTTMFLHIASGCSLFILIPFTKLAHCALFPLVRLASEVGWHFPPDAGDKVAVALHGDERRPV